MVPHCGFDLHFSDSEWCWASFHVFVSQLYVFFGEMSVRGIGWRGRWEGGSGWGIHVIPWLIHVNVWQNPLQYCKVISLQLIKINLKKGVTVKKKRHLLLGIKPMTTRQSIKKCIVKAMVFPVVMYGCESWTIKKADCQRIDAFDLWCWRSLRSPLDSKDIKLVNPKGNQSWIFIGRTDAEAEAPQLWPPDVKSWLIGKDHDAGKDWGQEERDDSGWEGSMASLTQWTWVWANCRR